MSILHQQRKSETKRTRIKLFFRFGVCVEKKTIRKRKITEKEMDILHSCVRRSFRGRSIDEIFRMCAVRAFLKYVASKQNTD